MRDEMVRKTYLLNLLSAAKQSLQFISLKQVSRQEIHDFPWSGKNPLFRRAG
jgi:hypothetical protein